VFMVGLIHGGPDVGFGVYGCMLPTLSHVTPQHLRRLPASFTAAFPHAQCIALAGRLPGLMTAAGENVVCVCGRGGGKEQQMLGTTTAFDRAAC
jgi:hypothetical protein